MKRETQYFVCRGLLKKVGSCIVSLSPKERVIEERLRASYANPQMGYLPSPFDRWHYKDCKPHSDVRKHGARIVWCRARTYSMHVRHCC